MSEYQGLGSMTDITPVVLIKRGVFAYREFFVPSVGETYSLYNITSVRICYWLAGAAIVLALVSRIIICVRQNNTGTAVRLIILSLVIPVAIESVFLMCDTDTTVIYALMMFQNVFFWILAVWAADGCVSTEGDIHFEFGNLLQIVYAFVCILVMFESLYFGYSANVLYTEKAFAKEQTVSYYNRLISRIQSTEGYTHDMKIAYIGDRQKDTDGSGVSFFDGIYASGSFSYSNSNINDYNWKRAMYVWCGFLPDEVGSKQLKQLEASDDVANMSVYPDEGSIKIIDGVVVVKFAE